MKIIDFQELQFDDMPGGNLQEKTPCSSLPSKFSTSRAPIPARE
jgi:hypothetical protein